MSDTREKFYQLQVSVIAKLDECNALNLKVAEQDKTISELNAKLAEQIEINSTLAERLNANTTPIDVMSENLELNAKLAELVEALEKLEECGYLRGGDTYMIEITSKALAKAKQVKK